MSSVDYETEQATKQILASWYGPQAKSWQITKKTVVAVAEVLKLSGECGALFKLVPKPTAAFSGVGILGKMAYDYAKDAVKRSIYDNKYYNSCVKQAAADMREKVFSTTY